MEFYGIQQIGTLTKLVSGSKQWKSMEFGQQNGCQQTIQKYFKYLGGIIFHGIEYLIRHEVVLCFISSLN